MTSIQPTYRIPIVFSHQRRIRCFFQDLLAMQKDEDKGTIHVADSDRSERIKKSSKFLLTGSLGNHAVLKIDFGTPDNIGITVVYPGYSTRNNQFKQDTRIHLSTKDEKILDLTRYSRYWYVIRHGVGKHNNMKMPVLGPLLKLLRPPTDALLQMSPDDSEPPGFRDAINALSNSLKITAEAIAEEKNKTAKVQVVSSAVRRGNNALSNNLKITAEKNKTAEVQVFSSAMRRAIETAHLFMNALEAGKIVGVTIDPTIKIVNCAHEVISSCYCKSPINSKLFWERMAAENHSICADEDDKKSCKDIQTMLKSQKTKRSKKQEKVIDLALENHKDRPIDWNQFDKNKKCTEKFPHVIIED